MTSSSSDAANGPRVAYITSWVGDYHAPRLLGAQKALEAQGARLSVLQFGTRSGFYTHQQKRRDALVQQLDFKSFSGGTGMALVRQVWSVLRQEQPDHLLVLGYHEPISLTGLAYARLHGKKVTFLSESKADDHPRRAMVERAKSLILKAYNSGVVGGNRHRDYFRSLGFKGPVEIGYDVIDNGYFHDAGARYARKRPLMTGCGILPKRYVLCVSRLVGRKRVPLALELFAKSGLAAEGVTFVLVGDGPLRAEVDAAIVGLGIRDAVLHLPMVANHRMPAYYACAEVVVLASEYDQWGLCINEAMACGTPTFLTPRCGSAGEIVTPENGVVFDAPGLDEAAQTLFDVVTDTARRQRMSEACLETMKNWDTDAFGNAIWNVVDAR